MEHTPTVGTVSQATLRTCDLVQAFNAELERLLPDACPHVATRWDHYDTWEAAEDAEPEEMGYLLERLTESLEALAPDGLHFGTLEGDGADFGFWTIDTDEV